MNREKAIHIKCKKCKGIGWITEDDEVCSECYGEGIVSLTPSYVSDDVRKVKD